MCGQVSTPIRPIGDKKSANLCPDVRKVVRKIFQDVRQSATICAMSQRNESIREALQVLLEGQVVTQVEKSVGMARGSLTRKVTGDRATRIDDVILVGEALGIDPIPVLESTGALTPRPEHHQHSRAPDLSSIPDDEIFREAAKRRSMQAEQWDELAWAASKRRKE